METNKRIIPRENNIILLLILNNKNIVFNGPGDHEGRKISTIVEYHVKKWKDNFFLDSNPIPQYITYLPNMVFNDASARNSFFNVERGSELYQLIEYLHDNSNSFNDRGMRIQVNDIEEGDYGRAILRQLEAECIMETLCYLNFSSPNYWYPLYKNAVEEYLESGDSLLSDYPRLNAFLKKKTLSENDYLKELMNILLPLQKNNIPSLESLREEDYALINDASSLFLSGLPIVYVNTSIFYILLGLNKDVYTYCDQYTGKHTIVGYVNGILQKVTYNIN